MRQRPYRGLREVNVWQRGIDHVRAAYRSRTASPRTNASLKAQRRRPMAASAPRASGSAQVSLGVLGALSAQTAPVVPRPAPQRCGASAEIHLSIASRLTTAARNQRARGMRLGGRASLGPVTRRELRAWQRGGDFVQAAKRPDGGWRQVWQKLFGLKSSNCGILPVPRAIAGQGPEAMRIYLRSAARRRSLSAMTGLPMAKGKSSPAKPGWGALKQRLQSGAAPDSAAKKFRDARWRQIGLGLLARVFGRSQAAAAAAQPPYRPAAGLPTNPLPELGEHSQHLPPEK